MLMKTQPSRENRSHPNRFGELIEAEGYSKGSITKYKSNALALWEALSSAKLSPADLTDEIMEQLAVPIVEAASEKDQKHCRYRLNRFRAYGTGPMLGWLVDRKIAPHIPVIDKSGRSDGTWTRAEFEWDAENDQYICPEGHELKQFRRNYSDPNRGPTGKGTARYRALKDVCQTCPSKAKCCPKAEARKITREDD